MSVSWWYSDKNIIKLNGGKPETRKIKAIELMN